MVGRRQKKDLVLSLFREASSLDSAGKEKAAEAIYRKVYQLGPSLLPRHQQPRFYLQFGSTLRNNKKLRESSIVLRQGIRRHPKFRALKLFLALTEFYRKKQKLALKSLLEDALSHPDSSIRTYSRAISHYLNRL